MSTWAVPLNRKPFSYENDFTPSSCDLKSMNKYWRNDDGSGVDIILTRLGVHMAYFHNKAAS